MSAPGAGAGGDLVHGGVFRVEGPAPLRGRLRVPGDKSESHRALLLAARAAGTSRLTGLSGGDDVVRTAAAVAALGARLDPAPPPGPVPGGWATTVTGGGLGEPAHVLDCGNSGTAMRLLAGYAAGLAGGGLVVLDGDDSLARRPMDRVVGPLRALGAEIDGRDAGRLAPLVVRGRALPGGRVELAVPSAQVKGALLLSGLDASGPTTVVEAHPTRRHTEELLARFGARVDVAPLGPGPDAASAVTLHPGPLRPADVDVPGDPSQAAFWVVAACLVPGSDLVVEHVYLGEGRAGFVDVLVRMGADLTVVRAGDGPVGDLVVRASALRGTVVEPAEIPGLVDEVPVLAVAAAAASGPTSFRGAGELRVKESDRIATVAALLGALGVDVATGPDHLDVAGGGLAPGVVESHGDHRIAMAGAVAGLAAGGVTEIRGWDAVSTSYPGFARDLRACTAAGPGTAPGS